MSHPPEEVFCPPPLDGQWNDILIWGLKSLHHIFRLDPNHLNFFILKAQFVPIYMAQKESTIPEVVNLHSLSELLVMWRKVPPVHLLTRTGEYVYLMIGWPFTPSLYCRILNLLKYAWRGMVRLGKFWLFDIKGSFIAFRCVMACLSMMPTTFSRMWACSYGKILRTFAITHVSEHGWWSQHAGSVGGCFGSKNKTV